MKYNLHLVHRICSILVTPLLLLLITNTSTAQTFSATKIIDSNIQNPQSVYAADFNGDDTLDVMAASKGDGIRWYENEGKDSFTAHTVDNKALGAQSVHAADIDGDNDMDIVAAVQNTATVNWYENDGTGNFRKDTVYNYLRNTPTSVYAADINNNGNTDVAAALKISTNKDSLIWYKNTGNQNFKAKLLAGYGRVNDVHVDTVLTSGKQDIISANTTCAWRGRCSPITILYWTTIFMNSVTVQQDSTGRLSASYASSINTADFNNDNATDITGVSSVGLHWYENINSRYTKHRAIDSNVNGESVTTGTFNSDNYPDVVLSSNAGNSITFYRNNPQQNFNKIKVTDSVNNAKEVHAVDLSNNGLDDILVADNKNNRITWYKTRDCPLRDTLSVDACYDYTVPSGNTTLTRSTTYVDAVSLNPFCDSIYHINLTIVTDSTTIDTSVCYRYTVPSGDTTLTQSTLYTDTIPSNDPCDSLVFINLSIDTSSSVIDTAACYRYTVPSRDTTLTKSTTYLDTLTNSKGCDSLITIHFSRKVTDTTINVNACYQYTVPSGDTTLSANTTYVDTLTNQAKCDSLITINLSTDTSSARIDTSVCQSYTVPSKDTTLSSPTTYVDTLTNKANCDSLVTIDLSLDTNHVRLTRSACYRYTVPSNDTVLYQSTNYVDTLTNAANCDSFIHINLSIDTSRTTIDTSACYSYTVPSEDTTLTKPTTYTDTLINAKQCDSLISIKLKEVYKPTVTVTKSQDSLYATDSSDFSYQWLNCQKNFKPLPGETSATLLPDSSGRYAVKIKQNGCADTSDCYSVNITGIPGKTSSSLTIYPNPVKEKLFVEFREEVVRADLKVFTMQGKIVHQSEKKDGKQLSLNLSELSNGLYFIRVETEQYRHQQIFLKE